MRHPNAFLVLALALAAGSMLAALLRALGDLLTHSKETQ